jgi:hypothetical protein
MGTAVTVAGNERFRLDGRVALWELKGVLVLPLQFPKGPEISC